MRKSLTTFQVERVSLASELYANSLIIPAAPWNHKLKRRIIMPVLNFSANAKTENPTKTVVKTDRFTLTVDCPKALAAPTRAQ